MRFPEKEIPLKDGRAAILRSPSPEDAEEMLSFLTQVMGETDFLLSTPEEFSMPPEKEAAFLESLDADENSMMLICVIDSKIVGNCSISRSPKVKICHRATLAIAILEGYWGLGIGTAMFQELIHVAETWNLTQLELGVLEGNVRARSLYEKMGFHVTGVIPNAIRQSDGSFASEYQMVRPM